LLLPPGILSHQILDAGVRQGRGRGQKEVEFTDPNYVRSLLPRRPVDAHKKSSGKVLVVAGSSGMAGAAKLTAMAALRSGAGIVKLAVPKVILNNLNLAFPEIITQSFDKINLKEPDVIAIGPGLSGSDEAMNIVTQVMKTKTPKVIDADALNIIAGDNKLANKLKSSPVIVTLIRHHFEESRWIFH
jgi:NAD(P)H-hydrate epimerase